VPGELVEFDERALVEQELEPLASGQLAARMLLLDTRRAATKQRFGSHLPQPVDPLLVGRHWRKPSRLCARTAS
jgi:hypothetical protein